MSLECEHGQLARACNICEYEREIAELRARVGELEAERDAECRGWFGNPDDPEWETEVKRINENFGL